MLESTPIIRPSPRPREGAKLRRARESAAHRLSDAPEISVDVNTPVIELYQGTSATVATPRLRSETANRAVNVALALLAIAVLAPVFLLVALVVWATSRGPVIYVQERVGIDRRARRTLAMYDRRGSDVGGSVF